MSHTPGPWVAVEAYGRAPLPAGVPVAVQRADDQWAVTGTICEMVAQGDGTYDPQVTAANAHLIAAAPMMYEALRSIENDDGTIPAAIWEMCNAALAAARGEGAE